MKKLHIILAILNIVSIILLIQIVFSWIPSFECDYPVDKIDRINSLSVDLSIGVITSTLFYYLLVVIPEKKKRKATRLINQNLLNFIVNNMQEIIAYFTTSYSINSCEKYYSDINESGFNQITEIRDIQTDFWFRYETKTEPIIDFRGYSEMAFINLHTDSIKSKAEYFLSLPIITFEDEHLIDIIAKIDNCQFIWAINTLYLNRKNEVTIPEIGQYIIPFYRLYLELLKYTKPSYLIIKEGEAPTMPPLNIELT
jgi:hypothetical protein